MKLKFPKVINLEKVIKHRETREWVEALIFAVIFATIFRTWLYSPFRVPTGSMVPTIEIGDQLFANMHYYGFVIPFTDKKILAFNEVERGDIVIFPSPKNPAKCENSFYSAFDTVKSLLMGFVDSQYVPDCVDFIKRAVALGGDKVEFVGEEVYVNGKKEEGYSPYFNRDILPDRIYYGETVPEGHVFVLGDNRRNSHDSRYWNLNPSGDWGYVAQNKIRAKAMFVYLSFEPGVPFYEGLRFGRMFNDLH